MKNTKILQVTLFIALLFTVRSVFADTKTWDIDTAHTKIQFSVTHMMISSTTGDFKVFEGKVVSKGDDFADSEIEFSIDVNSLDTDNEKRDSHLKSESFFSADKYPSIDFKGKLVKKTADNMYKMVGDFTIRDVTKKVEFDVIYGGSITDPRGDERAGFKISGRINRFDYNLTWNKLLESGGIMVGKTVSIDCNVEIIRKAEKVSSEKK
ncbi:MAG: YceI family protein [Candidatus Anammoxibacter sp.]